MKNEKQKVIKKLQKLREKMQEDLVVWASLYQDSGAIEYLTKNHEECFSVNEIINGEVYPDDINYQTEYIKKYVKENNEKD